MGQSLTNLLTHVIFSTKDRAPFLQPASAPRIHAYLGGIVRHAECIPIEIGGISDHVHMLVAVHPTVAVAKLLALVKANSSTWIHEELRIDSFAWQIGYAAFSVSESNVRAVRQYIQNQEEHHRRRGFQEELTEFLEKNGVAFDPRYVWR